MIRKHWLALLAFMVASITAARAASGDSLRIAPKTPGQEEIMTALKALDIEMYSFDINRLNSADRKISVYVDEYVKGNEDILYPKWDKSHYKSGEAEYTRLERARKIHHDAADASASWGMFQIMGFNYAACGEKSVAGFVDMMSRSELHQLLLSARFIKSGGMLPALQQKNWAEFAKRYNGPAYAQNKYDEKLAAAYKKFI